MKGYIEDRVVELANFIIENESTVRAAAKKFHISKSTVHTVRSICVGWNGTSQCIGKVLITTEKIAHIEYYI